MRIFSTHWLGILLVLGLSCSGLKLQAATVPGFTLMVTPSTNSVTVSNALTYTINLTNQTGNLLANVYVTNTFSDLVILSSATNSQGSNSILSSSLVFFLGSLSNSYGAEMYVAIEPTTNGFLTNQIICAAAGITNQAITNIVTQVITAQADLGVTMTGPLQAFTTNAVITNDWMSYKVFVTNYGPDSVASVLLTNPLPTGMVFKYVTPTNQAYTLSGSNLIFNLGTLASNTGVALQLTTMPTNVAIMPVMVSVGANGLLDPNTNNNVAQTNLNIISYLDGTILVSTNSSQTNNLQNGLGEQFILLTNTGADAAAVRVVVTGLTNQLFNAVGTNAGHPFVYLSAPLAAGASQILRMQYFPRGAFPFTNGQLHAYPVPLPDWSPPAAVSASTNLNISRILPLTYGINRGSMLLEFPATTGKVYTVVYSDNMTFSNAQIAPPAVIAPATRVQWLDYGPPTTSSAPTNTATRFYRVYQNP